MKALAWQVAAAALLALAALVAVTLVRPGALPSEAAVARQIASELRCPDCQGLSVADSASASAAEIRRQITAQLAAGRTADQVRQSFVDRYGEWILLSPTAVVAWLLPFAVVAAGGVLLIVWLRGRRAAGPTRNDPSGPEVTEADRARARDEAEALDA